jgi:hypothetical protein
MSSGASDPIVVLTNELAIVIERWIVEHRAEHGSQSHGKGKDGWQVGKRIEWMHDRPSEAMPETGAVPWLAEWSGVNERAIRRILQRETEHTSLGLADMIIQAMERADIWRNGELHTMPNPRWSQERWVAWYIEERRGC